MHEVTVDIEQAGAVIGLMGDVGVPDLVVECLAGHGLDLRCDRMMDRGQAVRQSRGGADRSRRERSA